MRTSSVLHWFEELGRRAIFTSLVRSSARASIDAAGTGALLRDHPSRVLFIMEDAIGDMILSLPAIRAIAESHPETVVDVVTWSVPAEMLRGAPYVRRTVVFPRGDRRRLHAAGLVHKLGPYDVVVDGMVLCRHVRSRSFAMMLASGAHTWIGENDRGSDYLLNVTVPRITHATTHLARMLSLATPFYARPLPESRPLLVVSADERASAEMAWARAQTGLRVLVNVSTNGSERQWPADAFLEVVRHVRARAPTASVVVVALERDRHKAERVAAGGAASTHIPTVRELLALVESADLVVSPDTSVCHMAASFSRPLVSIHNAGKEQWLPFDTPGVRVIGPSPENLSLVEPETVCNAIDAVLFPTASVVWKSA